MKIPFGTIGIVTGVLIVGFVLGRLSSRVDNQKLRDSLAVYREHRKEDLAENIQIRQDLVREHNLRVKYEDATLRLTENAERLISGASRTMVSANETRRRADSIMANLRNAKTARDTADILTNACAERSKECVLVRQAHDSLKLATDSLKSAQNSSEATIASFRRDSTTLINRINRDSTRLAEADGLIMKLQKAVTGCQVRLIRIPCPIGIANYSITDKTFSFGGGIPVKRWFTISVTWTP
jgi:hypothetical protein